MMPFLLFSNAAHATLPLCRAVLSDPTELTIRTVIELGEVHRGERESTEAFANESIAILVDAIEHHSFKDMFLDGLRQAREYLRDKNRLTTRETLLSAIIEFNIRDSNSNGHIERAIQILRSIPVPSRRRPEFNWHLAEFYYKLGDKETAYNLVLYIMNTARLQSKTLFYFRHIHEELGEPDLPAQTQRIVKRNRYNQDPNFMFNEADWGPYIRVND